MLSACLMTFDSGHMKPSFEVAFSSLTWRKETNQHFPRFHKQIQIFTIKRLYYKPEHFRFYNKNNVFNHTTFFC